MSLVRINILTYNRPASLCRLLEDIKEHAPGAEVWVWDDGSPQPPWVDPAKDAGRDIDALYLGNSIGVKWQIAEQRHGKELHWKWLGRVWAANRASSAYYFIQLADDFRLCRNFLHRAIEAWDRIWDERKIAMNILRDDAREGRAQWTGITPHMSHGALRTGWIDGAYLAPRRFYELQGWEPPSVDPKFWNRRPERGSDVYRRVCAFLERGQHHVYCVADSLVVHVDLPSVMHPEARRLHPIRAIRFIDGEERHDELFRGLA